MVDRDPRRIDPRIAESSMMKAASGAPRRDGSLIPDPRLEMLSGIADKFSVRPQEIVHYVRPEEALSGHAIGGSESLVLFVTPPGEDMRVRKIWSEALISVKWDPDGSGVMAPPLEKAKMQISYLNGLPDEAKPYFPEILDQSERMFEKQTEDGDTVTMREITADQSYIEGVEVSSFVRDHQPQPEVVARIHREILRCLREKIHPHRKAETTEPTVEVSYLNKIADRTSSRNDRNPLTAFS